MARYDRLTVLNEIVGLGLVPVFYDGDAEVIREVTGSPGKVGYIDAAAVTDNTRVILRIP